MPYRTYSSPGGQVVNGVAYIYDPSLVVGEITGNFRPAITSDFAANISVSGLNLTVGSVAVTGGSVSIAGGSVAVSNTAPIPISGVVQSTTTIGSIAVTGGSINVSNTAPIAISGVVQTNATFDSTSIVNAQVTGNNINIISNTILSGISGLLDANLNTAAWVTGAVGITNTVPIAISGVVQTTTTVGNVAVTGGSINVSNNTPIPISGVVVTTATIGNLAVTGGSINVSNTAPIAISGVVVTNATFDSTSIVNAQVTGNTINSVSNVLLSGVSGLLTTVVETASWVTGAVGITNTAPIAISGVVQTVTTIDSTPIVNSQVSGNNIATVSNVVLSGISGLLGSSLTDPAWVTGQVSLVSSAPIAISGVVQTTATIGNVAVTGGSINVSNTTPIPISGVVQSTLDPTSIVNAQVTGNNINVTSNALLSGISGILINNPQRSSWVTGQVSLTNTAPIAISGVVQTTTTVGNVAVTGGSINVNNTAPIAISGVVQSTTTIGSVAVTGGSINVSNTTPIAISGVVQTNATFDSTSIVNAQVTGNNINLANSVILSGISGVLASNPQRSSWVTGQVSLTNTAPIAISGVVQTTTTVGNVAVTGGFINISNTAPIAVSGVVQATLDPTAIVNAQTSGNNINITSNALLSGISGLLSTTFTTASWVTGNVGITNTAPIAISGVVQTTATIGNVAVTGGFINVSNTAPLPISGVVVSSAAATPTTASTPAVSGINNSGWGVALGTNTNRRGWGIQNLSTGVIRINFSSTLPSATAAHLFLKGGSAQNDGLGAAYIENPAFYAGPVSVSGDFNVNPVYTIWQV